MDEIIDFVFGLDKIILDVIVFIVIKIIFGESLDEGEFVVVDNEIDVFSVDVTIVYNLVNSILYYNFNGVENGLGDGGSFVLLFNEVFLSVDDFLVRV